MPKKQPTLSQMTQKYLGRTVSKVVGGGGKFSRESSMRLYKSLVGEGRIEGALTRRGGETSTQYGTRVHNLMKTMTTGGKKVATIYSVKSSHVYGLKTKTDYHFRTYTDKKGAEKLGLFTHNEKNSELKLYKGDRIAIAGGKATTGKGLATIAFKGNKITSDVRAKRARDKVRATGSLSKKGGATKPLTSEQESVRKNLSRLVSDQKTARKQTNAHKSLAKRNSAYDKYVEEYGYMPESDPKS